jgi:hypothetical protein
MLKNLYEKIEKIVPIHGVVDFNDYIEVQYIDEPTTEQKEKVQNILNEWPLEKAKIEKIQNLDKKWQLKISNGWESIYGWKLGIDSQDVALLTGSFMLAKEAQNMGISTPATIIDLEGDSHALSLEDLTVLMLAYGQARVTLSSEDAAERKAINEASSLQELNAI